ncbi:MAG: RidA family protein [Acidaminococcus sp.]|jgi:2-iminobutanoate/2-iminopropanoate deaminase|nr:RidA family protein [Acidaminococcus sp.]MCI2100853.1 RidA family protein [Acidaminococcus sp.]MCI2115216.1 RidA family protein [Acidaminococcus sp.]MCI2116651.1 RidA family protein [Acidaminococcus sp.]
MKKFAINDEEHLGPAYGPYSEALVVDKFFYTGMIGSCGKEGKLPESVYEQTKQIFANTELLLKKAGGSLADLVNVTVFMADLSEFDEMNRAYKECLTQKPFPARATVAAKELLPGVKVEMILTAYIDE